MEMQHQRPLDIKAFDLRLKVVRAGKTLEISSVAHFSPEEKAIRGFHTHFTYEIFFVTEGSMELVLRDQTVTYERKVVVVPPRIHHFTNCNNHGCYSLLFSFEQKELPSYRQWLLEERLRQGVLELPISDDMCFYIRKLAQKSLEESPVREQECTLLANLIFFEVLGQLLPERKIQQQKERGNAKHIFRIERYINSHLSEKITLQGVAEHMHLSTRQVERIVRKEYGCTLAQLVVDKKLAYAEGRLKNSKMSMEQIAASLALGSSYFYTLFKKQYAMTPLQYRKRHQQKQ